MFDKSNDILRHVLQNHSRLLKFFIMQVMKNRVEEKSEIFTAVTTTLFWYLTNYALANIQRRFGETGNSPLKRRYISNSVREKGEIPIILTHAIRVRGAEEYLNF